MKSSRGCPRTSAASGRNGASGQKWKTNLSGGSKSRGSLLRSNNLALSQSMKIVQKLLGNLEKKIVDFHHFVFNSRKIGNYKLMNISNMDETPVWFDMPLARTVNT